MLGDGLCDGLIVLLMDLLSHDGSPESTDLFCVTPAIELPQCGSGQGNVGKIVLEESGWASRIFFAFHGDGEVNCS